MGIIKLEIKSIKYRTINNKKSNENFKEIYNPTEATKTNEIRNEIRN